MRMVVDEDVRPHDVALWEVLACAAGAREVAPARMVEIAAHLERCSLCRARLKDIPEIDYMLALDEDPEAPTPRQRDLVAEVYRQARRQLRLDRLWVLGVALPLKGLLLRRGLRARGPMWQAVSGGVVGALTVAVLRYLLRRKHRGGSGWWG
jgi:predicted anti-sigma-YlaC factor YlaD